MTAIATDKIREIIGRLPTPRDEDWKYTDLSRARDISLRWLDDGAQPSSVSLEDEIKAITDAIEADWCVIADGRLLELPDGIGATRTDEIQNRDGALSELNSALLVDGLQLRIDGERDKPIGLLFMDSTGVSQGYACIELADNASAQIVEYHASRGDGEHYANSIVDISLSAGARLRHTRVQDRALGHVHTGLTGVTVGRDAQFLSANFDLGGGLVRNDIFIDIAEPGADASFDGLYLAGDGQHIDNHTRIDHRVGPATSQQEYRGILNGKCRCVWNGKAIVHEGADGTDADQANHNLLLSEKAEIDAKPELEIYTDDVKCSHGTTVGQLDEAALFYLRSRGLDTRHATQVLTHAFGAGLVSRIPVEAAKEHVSQLMESRLAALIGEELEQ